MQTTVRKIYDPLKGRYIREMRSNDIVHLSVPYDTYSAGTIVSMTLDSNTELFITGVGYSATTATDFYVLVNSATILPAYLSENSNFSVTTDINAPIYKATPSSTISIGIGTDGTVSAFLYGVRFPKFEKVET